MVSSAMWHLRKYLKKRTEAEKDSFDPVIVLISMQPNGESRCGRAASVRQETIGTSIACNGVLGCIRGVGRAR